MIKMNDHKRYLIQERLKHDLEQTILSEKGITKNQNYLAQKMIQFKDNQNVFCPFCLHRDLINKFLVSTKEGFSRRFGKCPECQNNMLLETLIRMLEMNAKGYADFVYNYPNAEFWRKVSPKFDIWKKRLWNLNMANDFWEEYKQLKEGNEYEKSDSDDN